MATEAEIKAQERRELLNEVKRRRAAAAQAEGSLGAAERGDYGEVGQGEPKGEFDDEINQDPSMALTSINSLIRPLKSDLVGERGERDYKKPEEQDNIFKAIARTKPFQKALEKTGEYFSGTTKAETPLSQGIFRNLANLYDFARIDEGDLSGKLIEEIQNIPEGEKSLKALLAYPALALKGAQKVTNFLIPKSSADAARDLGSGKEVTRGQYAEALLPMLEFVPGLGFVPVDQLAKAGLRFTKDAAENVKMMNAYKVELAKGDMSLNDIFNNIEAKSVGAKAVNESRNVKRAKIKDVLLNKIGKENLENMTSKEIIEVLENKHGIEYNKTSLREMLKKLDINPVRSGKNLKYGPVPNLTDAATEYLINNPQVSNSKARLVFINEPNKYLKPGITDVNVKTISERKQSLIKSEQIERGEGLLSKERKEDTFTDFKSNLENVDMNDPQAVLDVFRNSYKKGYAETTAAKQYEETGSLSQSPSASKKINDLIDEFENTEGGFKILKQNEIDKLKPKKKDTSDIYAEYYRKEFSPNTAVINVKKSSEFRFFDNKRRTLDDQAPEEFFSEYSLKDIEKGGKFHNEYLQFKAIDDVRIKNVENLQPILRKIFTKVREGTPNQKESLVNLNIAHKFESSGIKKGYVSETKTGKGTDPTEIYIDVSEYNQTIQPSLEAEARKLYNRYLEFGDEADYIKLEKIDKDMKVLGIEGEIAPGQKIGQAMPFDEKIRQLADEAIDNNFITQNEYDQLINSAEEIAQSKIKFFDTFGIKANYAGGGIVGINYLTRPL